MTTWNEFLAEMRLKGCFPANRYNYFDAVSGMTYPITVAANA